MGGLTLASDEKEAARVVKSAREALEGMERLVAELQLKGHLASMDAQKSWDETRPRVQRFVSKGRAALARASDEGELQAHLALMDLHGRWLVMRDEVDSLSRRVHNEGIEKVAGDVVSSVRRWLEESRDDARPS